MLDRMSALDAARGRPAHCGLRIARLTAPIGPPPAAAANWGTDAALRTVRYASPPQRHGLATRALAPGGCGRDTGPWATHGRGRREGAHAARTGAASRRSAIRAGNPRRRQDDYTRRRFGGRQPLCGMGVT